MKHFINNLLSALFPYKEHTYRTSVFIQDTWLERIMRPTQVKDYMWHNKNS